MRPSLAKLLRRVLVVLACVLVLRVTASVVSNYRNYVPPNFSSDFLRGRESHFWGLYQWAFYAHIVSGPITLVLGLVLLGERFRNRFPQWHRVLGRVQAVCVLLVVAPSGLWMARYAAAGPIGGAGLASLAIATAICVAIGTWSALKRRFRDHRRWMWRCYLLLSSAVVLRLIGGFATVTGMTFGWVDPLANWVSWLAPLAAFEWYERTLATPRSIKPDRPRMLATAALPKSTMH